MEKDKACQEMIMRWFDDKQCVFGDIMQCITNAVPDDHLLDPGRIKFKSQAPCVRHNQKCSFKFDKASQSSVGILGSPCVLFSKNLSINAKFQHCL